MATLDKIIDLQKQGLQDTQIIQQLKNEGISPQEINDSLNQARIKNAVSPSESGGMPKASPEMEQSIMKDTGQNVNVGSQAQPTAQPTQQPASQEFQTPQAPEVYPPQTQAPTEGYQAQPSENYYQDPSQGGYPQQDYYAPQGTADTETISEIAEQVVLEKFAEFKKKTGDIASFKIATQEKITDIDERLKRIESSIDKLQQAVIGKIGEFGENTALIHKDLNNLHETVSKLMNPLVDNFNELKKISK